MQVYSKKAMFKTIFLIKSFCVFCALCCLSFDSIAAENDAETATLKKYNSGIFINRINEFDVKTGTAEVDFWYWVVSDDKNLSLQKLELSNGKLEPIGDVITQNKNKKYYLAHRYIAQAKCVLNLKEFPFDTQKVVLSFEDGELTLDQMIFVPDKVNSGIDMSFQMNEWIVKGVEYQVGDHYYPSTFGDLDIPSGQGSHYSQFKVIITLERRGSFWQKLFKYFWAVVVSVLVGLFALLIRVCDLDGRFGMVVGALFANVGCSFLLADKLPESPVISRAEWVSYISLGFIMLFIVESIISLAFYNNGYTKFSRWMDFSVFIFSMITYSGIWFFI